MRIFPAWWRTHFLWAEFGLSVLVGLVFCGWATGYGGVDTLQTVLAGNRGAIYGALASVFGSLLGFAITAVSIVIGFASHDRLALIRQSPHYPTIWKVFFAAIRALGFATLVAMTSLILDRDNAPRYVLLFVMFFATALATLRVARCAWVLENVIELVAVPERERQ